MYYKEKLINGVLMFQNQPDGDWQQVSIEAMSRRCFKRTEQPKEYVAVPKALLVKLEEARVNLYDDGSLDSHTLLSYTGVM